MKNIHLYVSKVVTTICTIFFNVYLAKTAGLAFFGVFSLMLSITFIYLIINDWGLSMYGPIEVNRQSEVQKSIYLKKIVNFKLLITCVSVLLYVATIYIFYDKHAQLLILGVFIIISNLFNLDWLLRTYQYFKLVSFRQVFYAISNLMAVVLIYYFKVSVFFVFLSYGVLLLISQMLGVFFLVKKDILKFSKLGFRDIWIDSLEVLRSTKTAFLGLFIFNLLFSFNIPVLTFFTSEIEASGYASYYNIFASVVAIVAIAQDINFPKFTRENYPKHFHYYTRLIYAGLACAVLVLAALPFYYNIIYPRSFILNALSVELVTLLGFLYSFRLLYIHSYLIKANYRHFFYINLISLCVYIITIAMFISTKSLNTNTAFASLIIPECIVIVFSIKKENMYSNGMLYILFFLACVLVYNYFYFSQIHTAFVFAGILIIMLFTFYKRLTTTMLTN